MIDTNEIKTRVESLAKKSQKGYLSSDDFNSDLKDANLTLFEFYVDEFEKTQRILDGLLPFIKEITIPLTPSAFSAIGNYPSDYAHDLELGVLKVTNNPENDCKGKGCGKKGCKSCGQGATPKKAYPPITKIFPCDYLASHEEKYTLSSGVRKPSMKKNIFRWSVKNGQIHAYPKELSSLYFKYLRQPATPVWGFTNVSTASGDFQQFNAATSVNPEFPDQEFSNLVDLCLFYLGVQIRESALIQFAKMKQTQPLVQ